MNMKKIYTTLIAFIFLPLVSFAAPETNSSLFENPLKSGTGGGVSNIYVLVSKILDFVVQIGAIAVIFAIIYAGFLFVKAQGNETAIEAAKKTLFTAVIGGVILLGAKTFSVVVCNTAKSLGAQADCSLIK